MCLMPRYTDMANLLGVVVYCCYVFHNMLCLYLDSLFVVGDIITRKQSIDHKKLVQIGYLNRMPENTLNI